MRRRASLFVALAIAASALAAGAVAGPLDIHLPNDWTIASPAGPVGSTGTLPHGITLARDGRRAFIVDAGYAAPGLRVIDSATLATLGRVPLADAFGPALRDPGSDNVWVAAGGANAIVHVDTTALKIDRTIALGNDFYATSIARSPDGKTLAVTGDLANRIDFIDERSGTVAATWGTGSHPIAAAFAPDGATAFVADWGARTVDVVDPHTGVIATITVGLHPSAIVATATRLYVADADDDDVSIIDIQTKHVIARAGLGLGSIVGASPNSLLLDGDRLYVTCGAANAVVVLGLTDRGATALGALRTGWYPTAIAIDPAQRVLLVVNGKGEGGHANPEYLPLARLHAGDARRGYIAGNLIGSVRRLPLPDDAALIAGTRDVMSAGPPVARASPPADAVVRANGPIRHVIYVIKENRTYDQVLGDIPNADGAPQLVMFGQQTTPNQHALARRFGVFDRFFDNAHVSADGHNWSMAAFANDYLEKMWPPEYAGRRGLYDFEDGARAATPHAGYLWDLAARSGVSFRNYGEFTSAGALKGDNVTTDMPALRDRTDLHFPTFDMSVPDVDRLAEWKREYTGFVQTRTLPQLEVVRFPRDHTAGTSPGSVTPQGMLADNDLAVGGLVDAVSHGPNWRDTAIFILEDDAQNGADHIDEQRSTFYLISPYAAGGVQHATYTTASVVRTIEILLGMPPLTPYDAGARPLTGAFTATPHLQPYDVVPETVDTHALNGRAAYRARDSARMDFRHADRAPAAELNEILWHAVRDTVPAPASGALDR